MCLYINSPSFPCFLPLAPFISFLPSLPWFSFPPPITPSSSSLYFFLPPLPPRYITVLIYLNYGLTFIFLHLNCFIFLSELFNFSIWTVSYLILSELFQISIWTVSNFYLNCFIFLSELFQISIWTVSYFYIWIV